MSESHSLPRHILFATDLSARCDRAQDRAIALAQQWGAKLTVLHALDVLDAPNDQPSRPTAAGARERALRVMKADFASAEGIQPDFTILEGKPDKVALQVAKERGCDIVIVGIAGNSPLGQTVLGSTVTALSRHADMPVLVVKKRVSGDYREILVASDLSRASRTALDAASAMFAAPHISLFHAFAPSGDKFGAEQAARTFLGDASFDVIAVQGGDAAIALADYAAENNPDLVVVGSHGAAGLLTVLLGSTAIAILDETPSDILVVPVSPRRIA